MTYIIVNGIVVEKSSFPCMFVLVGMRVFTPYRYPVGMCSCASHKYCELDEHDREWSCRRACALYMCYVHAMFMLME